MRLVSAFLFVALTGSAVLAEDAKPADPQPEVTTATKKKVPYRVVKILPETGQVLLFDRNHATHVVAEPGQVLDGYTVDEIDEDEVTLLADSGASVILTAPPPPPKKRTAKAQPVDPYADSGAASDGATAATIDGATAEPGATAAASATAGATGTSKGRGAAPVDPYADPEAPVAPGEGGVRVASAADPSTATVSPSAAPSASVTVSPSPGAPIVDSGAPELSDPYGDPGIAAFADAVGAAPPAPAETAAKPAGKPTKAGKGSAKPAASPDAASALASAATGRPAAATAAPAGSIVVARAELDAALGDFTKTAGTFRAAFTADGLRFDAIAEGSLLAKAGLRKGDIVTYVDGKPLRSLDDAASLYARAGTMKATTLQVARDGKNVTLRVAIK